MRAVRLYGAGGALKLEQLPTTEPTGAQVRIRVAGCGVCRSDLHIVDGTQTRVSLPVTLGHEVAGFVEAVGPEVAGGPPIGAAVVVHGGWGCGECRECMTGAEQLCEQSRAPGFQADGGYAETMLVPHARHLVPLGNLDPVVAAPLADAGITPYRAVRRAERWLVPGARVLVIGAGGLGQFALQYLRLLPAAGAELSVAVQELSASRGDRATELGADVAMLDAAPDALIAVLGGRADVILDFVGTDATLSQAAAVVAPGGLVILIGEARGSMPFGFDDLPAETWLTTAAWGSHADLRDVVRLAEEGHLRWQIEAVPLEDAPVAHARLRAGGVAGRLVLVP